MVLGFGGLSIAFAFVKSFGAACAVRFLLGELSANVETSEFLELTTVCLQVHGKPG